MTEVVVTSCESDLGTESDFEGEVRGMHDEEDDSSDRSNPPGATNNRQKEEEEEEEPGEELFYDKNADEEDAIYVEKHYRDGATTKIHSSDAVLSCPCCFVTVCMDCQKHEHYHNQYRAMFVRNILVRWDQIWIYDNRKHPPQWILRQPQQQQQQQQHPQQNDSSNLHIQKCPEEEVEELYYTVCCSNCSTQVALLDMNDEVYHFYGCIAST